jgi:hypothetical protein
MLLLLAAGFPDLTGLFVMICIPPAVVALAGLVTLIVALVRLSQQKVLPEDRAVASWSIALNLLTTGFVYLLADRRPWLALIPGVLSVVAVWCRYRMWAGASAHRSESHS